MKIFMTLLLLEYKKLARNSKALVLPILFYLLASLITLSFVPLTPETAYQLRIFLWILVSLSLKLSFGTFLHQDVEQNLISILMVQRFPIGRLLLIKVFLSTVIFSGLFMLLFFGIVFLHVVSFRDVLALPVFVGGVFVLQVGIEVLTLKTRTARYLCYLLLLPFEIPLLILVISHRALSTHQLAKTMGGYFIFSVSVLFCLCTFIFSKNKNACNF